MFSVKVASVKTVSVKGKKKKRGLKVGTTKNWKKAYITLAEGQNIDFMNNEV